MGCPGGARVLASWLKILVGVVELKFATDIVMMFLIWSVLRADWLLRGGCESSRGRRLALMRGFSLGFLCMEIQGGDLIERNLI